MAICQHRIRQVIDLASRLQLDPDDIPRRLAENSLRDPVPAVRVRNFDALLERFPDAEVTAQTASSLLAVEIPALRLRAARFLKTPEAIVALQSLLDEPEAGDEIHVSALKTLAVLLPPHDLAPLLERVLAADDVVRSLRLAAVQEIAGRGLKDAVPCLVAEMPGADHEIMITIAAALGALGDASVEPALLSQLVTEVEPTQIAIVRALGAVGTSAAVEPLLPLAKGYFRSPELKKAVREAIASIQGRLHGAEQGQLSLAEHTDRQGALSLSGEEGRLTVAEPPEDDDDGRPPAPAE